MGLKINDLYYWKFLFSRETMVWTWTVTYIYKVPRLSYIYFVIQEKEKGFESIGSKWLYNNIYFSSFLVENYYFCLKFPRLYKQLLEKSIGRNFVAGCKNLSNLWLRKSGCWERGLICIFNYLTTDG